MNLVYTANIGEYDTTPPLPKNLGKDWEAIYITDDVYTTPRGWRSLWIDRDAFGDLPAVAIAKWCKIQPEYWLYPVLQQSAGPIENILWIDANVEIRRPLDDLVRDHGGEFVTQTHPANHTFYQEIAACKTHKRAYLDGLRDNLDAMETAYRERGVPDDDGNANQNRIILRQPTERTRVLQYLWWRELVTPCGRDIPCWRDQIALRAAAWEVGWNIECKHSFRQWFRKQRHTKSGAAWI